MGRKLSVYKRALNAKYCEGKKKSNRSLTFGSGYVSGSDSTGGELGASGSAMDTGVLGVRGLFRLDATATVTVEDTVTVPETVIFVGCRLLPLFGCSFAARCSARSLSKVLLRPMTVRRNETVCALHVSDLVQGLPVSSFQTPQCRSGSYSRSLSSERSALSLLRRGWLPPPLLPPPPLLLPPVPGLLPGLLPLLVETPTRFEGPGTLGEVVCTGIDSRGDRGDEIGSEPLADRFAWSVVRLTIVWFSFAPPAVGIEEDEGVGSWVVFFSLDTLQKGVFAGGFTTGFEGGGKLAVPEGWRHSVAK